MSLLSTGAGVGLGSCQLDSRSSLRESASASDPATFARRYLHGLHIQVLLLVPTIGEGLLAGLSLLDSVLPVFSTSYWPGRSCHDIHRDTGCRGGQQMGFC